MFLSIAKQTNRPLALIEIGTSSGLLLCRDKYNYEIQQQQETLKLVNKIGSLYIASENKGEKLPYFNHNLEITNRIGIDLNIINLAKKEDYEWMLALIWPEHSLRRSQFIQASNISKEIPKELYEGNMLELLPTIIKLISPKAQIVLFHTHVANQFPKHLKRDFENLLYQLSYHRSLYHVYNNMYDTNIHQDFIKNGEIKEGKTMPAADGHGKWFIWKNVQ
ncbi:DUF2332 domain-containing protein [Bacillus sp. JJ722]|uniref:DUF2332 domain-containing protein n=1 Tax=Bacillus sp. JJ722 TaxID=3122973 RepID=UPI002FFDFB49